MSDNIFTASNGIQIRSRGYYNPIEVHDVTSGWKPVGNYVEYSAMDNAMAEWYQHRRDAELGRWRDPENPNTVVYRDDDADGYNDLGRCVRLVYEGTGYSHRGWETATEGTVARYFAAHPEPEPRPWEDAPAGELWAIEIDAGPFPAISHGTGRFTDLHAIEWEHHEITHATRLYPPMEG